MSPVADERFERCVADLKISRPSLQRFTRFFTSCTRLRAHQHRASVSADHKIVHSLVATTGVAGSDNTAFGIETHGLMHIAQAS